MSLASSITASRENGSGASPGAGFHVDDAYQVVEISSYSCSPRLRVWGSWSMILPVVVGIDRRDFPSADH